MSAFPTLWEMILTDYCSNSSDVCPGSVETVSAAQDIEDDQEALLFDNSLH